MRSFQCCIIILILFAGRLKADDLRFKEDALRRLVAAIPDILKTYDARTGHFGEGLWICRDQEAMYPLAVVYAQKIEGNRYCKDPALLKIIMDAGDALIADADDKGRWVFRKKDGSTWGMIYMPWTYSRWLRAYSLIREDMPSDRREKWARALIQGYDGISRSDLKNIHNIATHHAMGLYMAGNLFDRPDWRRQAGDYMGRIIGAQSEGGYWSEGGGPVVSYNFVYAEALAIYYSMSRDERVMPALERAASYHYHFTYPDGTNVETIDQRNPYHNTVHEANVSFTYTALGRAYLHNLWNKLGREKLSNDLLSSLVLHGVEGPMAVPEANEGDRSVFLLRDSGQDRAAVVRQGPWFVCLSAYTSPISRNRWYQDRQNLLSIYHEKIGLIIGGGNTKLQPAWSNFTIGDMSLLSHKPGDTQPAFVPPEDKLLHVPSTARLVRVSDWGLECTYGPQTCGIRVHIENDSRLALILETSPPISSQVLGHITLLPHLGMLLETARGTKQVLSEAPINLSAEQVKGELRYGSVRLSLPEMASLHWPALPHNPYRIDGRAATTEGRIEVRFPFSKDRCRYEIGLEVLN